MAKGVSTKGKRALALHLESGGSISVSEAMRRVGYSLASSHNPQKLTKTPLWNELLNNIPFDAILAGIVQVATDKSDKRAMLQAGDMLLKLGDKYPAGKLKVQAYNEEIERLKEEGN